MELQDLHLINGRDRMNPEEMENGTHRARLIKFLREEKDLEEERIYGCLTRFHVALYDNLVVKGCAWRVGGEVIALCMNDAYVPTASDLHDWLKEKDHTEVGLPANVYNLVLDMTKDQKVAAGRDPSGLVVHKEGMEKIQRITFRGGNKEVWSGDLTFSRRDALDIHTNPPPLTDQVETLKTYVRRDAAEEFDWDLLGTAWTQLRHSSWLAKVDGCGGNTKGEMFFQQFVYPPFATAMLAAAQPLRHFNYCADQDVVGSLHVELNNDRDSIYVVYAKPDAALVCPSGDPLGLMEIKKWDSGQLFEDVDKADLAKCILWSCITALRLSKTAKEKPEIPFILGRGFYVHLYTTKLNDDGVPEIRYLHLGTDMRAKDDVCMVFADFVHLLGILSKSVRPHNVALHRTRKPKNADGVKNIFSESNNPKKRKSGRDGPRHSQGKTSSQKQGSHRGSFKEKKAMDAVLRVFDNPRATIRYPWPRYRNILQSEDEDWQYFQQKSPFFFRGECKGEAEVFFKVWREDDGESEDEIETEISLLRRAGTFGVSVPVVLDKFTRKVCVGDSTFQVLGMTDVGDTHHVSNGEELVHYALLLIQHILQLHEGGILHCDLKPDNIVWDPKSIKLTVVDFGHAQQLQNAVCYRGTKGFEAPELLTGDANSRASDAYSVGVTLKKHIEHCSTAGISTPDVVQKVVDGLMSGRSESRMTLPAALGLVRDYGRNQAQGVIQADRKRPWEGTGEYDEPRIQLLATQ